MANGIQQYARYRPIANSNHQIFNTDEKNKNANPFSFKVLLTPPHLPTSLRPKYFPHGPRNYFVIVYIIKCTRFGLYVEKKKCREITGSSSGESIFRQHTQKTNTNLSFLSTRGFGNCIAVTLFLTRLSASNKTSSLLFFTPLDTAPSSAMSYRCQHSMKIDTSNLLPPATVVQVGPDRIRLP